MCDPISYPPDIIHMIKKEFGLHPALKIQNRGSWWDNLKLRNLYYSLINGVKKRGEIIRMLLNKHLADLNIFTFGELHIAGHHFWHLNNKTHPAFASNDPPLPDFLKDIYQAVDDELGKLTDVLTGSEDLILFSPEGGDVNWCDLNSMVFLPEFLFRWNFPGEKLIPGDESDTTETPVIPETKHWVKSVWNNSFKNLPPVWAPGIFKNIFRNLADIDTINFPFYILRRLGDLQWHRNHRELPLLFLISTKYLFLYLAYMLPQWYPIAN